MTGKKTPFETFQIILGKNIKISEMVIAMCIIQKVYCSSAMFLLETIMLRRIDAERFFDSPDLFVKNFRRTICFRLSVELLGLLGSFVRNFCGVIRVVLQFYRKYFRRNLLVAHKYLLVALETPLLKLAIETSVLNHSLY